MFGMKCRSVFSSAKIIGYQDLLEIPLQKKHNLSPNIPYICIVISVAIK